MNLHPCPYCEAPTPDPAGHIWRGTCAEYLLHRARRAETERDALKRDSRKTLAILRQVVINETYISLADRRAIVSAAVNLVEAVKNKPVAFGVETTSR